MTLATKNHRTVQVTVARAEPDVFFANPLNTNAVVIRNLRMKFKVERSLEKTPNMGEIEIYNLAPSSRAAFARKPLHVKLEAGYRDDIHLLMAGDLLLGPSEHNGCDWITKIQFGDGERAFVNARVKESFGPGTSRFTAANAIAQSMGLKIPTNLKEAKELAGQFVSGISLSGPSREQMTKVLEPANMTWSVQSGTLQVLRDTDTLDNRAILISAKTGMIGSPTLDAPKKPGKPATVKVKTLIDAGLVPGCKIQIVADGTGGNFKVTKVTHTGDTRGKEFFSEVEGDML